ncbi:MULTISPECIES: energy transducer TonB [unclassified Salinivibrio]|uniref:energy transducer TonB n=1 Tax=unclassified Salinivibrio TaxID=2636825 RepID=UPI0009877885|nr:MULTISPECIES: energy transducer TonB [unclassified Salinivibrio]OOF14318.1 hypothetical protein BZG83_06185 [Salinivibrio sp. PR919]OOF18740.1 hypothetical protein BZG84_02530 [Salinivibrio sp. PR932]
MTVLAGLPQGFELDRTRKGWLVGALVSVSLHFGVAIAYFWTPARTLAPPPAAVPIAISVIAPEVSAPKVEKHDVKEGKPQRASQPADASETVAEKVMPTPNATPVVEDKKNAQVQKQPQSVSRPAKKPPKAVETKKTVETHKVQTTEPRLKPKESPKTSRASSVAKEASAPKHVDAPTHSEKVTGPAQGQLTVKGKVAKLNWQRRVHAHLAHYKRYPRFARRLKQQGSPRVTFTVNRQGEVQSVKLQTSSQFESLDEEAKALVQRASPLPTPPDALPGLTITVTVPIRFSL